MGSIPKKVEPCPEPCPVSAPAPLRCATIVGMRIHVHRTYSEPVKPEQVVSDLIADRDILDVETFLHPPHPTDISFESLFSQEDRPAFQQAWAKSDKLLKKIHNDQKPIVVYSDYDADGVTGGAIMWETLHKLGFKVMPYIPDRKEGYGFSKQGIDHVIAEYDPALIISVDHGIVAHKEIAYAASKNIPIVVTDHHHKQQGDPKDAFAVFHTTAVSGAGVAYFFTKQLVESFAATNPSPETDHLTYMMRSDYIALAAIGAIADLIPLVGAARSLARYGLPILSTTSRLGLRSLIKDAGISPTQPITTYHVGFMIAPRLNAFGRLHHAIDALRLLCTTSLEKTQQLTAQAASINSQRQKLVSDAVVQAEKMVNPDDRVIVLYSQTWEEGIIGLIASKLMQSHSRPVIVMTRSDGHAKASVRSIEGIHITDFLADLKDHLIDMGGHAAAAGFTIAVENVDAFTQAVRAKAAQEIALEMLVPSLHIDVDMPYTMATMKLAHALGELAPYGISFKEPLFRSRVDVVDVKAMGKTGSHIKLEVGSTTSSLGSFEVVCFGASEKVKTLQYGDTIDLVYTLAVNEWNGRQSLQGMLKEILSE